MDEVLLGGVANSGSVFRRGDTVLRPSSQHSETIHAYLRAFRATGFTGAPSPLALQPDHEVFDYIEGDVAIPPYPSWARSDSALTSVAELLRQFHDASTAISQPFLSRSWNDAFGPWPSRGRTICHFDVCLENVVFRNGRAIAFLDFDFAAPGDPVDDLASFARMCIPLDDTARLQQLGWQSLDLLRRLRLVIDAYELDLSQRASPAHQRWRTRVVCHS
jgi:aminoglycoside phosphotransferase (APT) family kinase protein